MYICVYIYYIFIPSSVGGQLGYFHILEIVNNVAVNIGVHVLALSLHKLTFCT